MYEMGALGLGFEASMGAGIISEVDAFKAYTRGENARMLASGPSVEVGSVDFWGENLVVSSDVTPEKSSGKSINDYIDYSIEYGKTLRENPDADIQKQESSKIIGSVSKRLINDISSDYGIDLSGKVHALIDNDIRHIINSHGEGTNEKYPVTANDLKQIPDIVENYDDVLYLPRKDGKKGIVYVKQHNGITYYLESIQNDNMLRNKQMIKVSTGTIPDLPGLQDAINTKWKHNQSFPDDKIPRMYGFPVRTAVSTDNIISDSSSDVNTTINSMGSNGTALYNRILEPIAKDTDTKASLEAYRNGFAHVYESGLKGVPYKRSKAQPLKLTQINAIYDAAKKDAATRANVKKKSNAKVHKDDFFYKAKVSKRTERILEGIARLVGRDIRFSDDVQGNARIDLTSGEIIISTEAKSGHTWAMIHEVYHALVVDSPAEAAVLKKTVLDIAKKNKAAFRKMLEKYESVYADELYDKDGNLRSDAAEYVSEEMVADLIGYTLSDHATLETLTGKQRSVFQKFADKLISIFGDRNLKDAKEYLSDADGDIRAIFKDVAKEADTIAQQFKAALESSQKAEKKTSTEEVRMSRDLSEQSFVKDKYYDRKIDRWNDIRENYITVGKINANSALSKVGVPEGKVFYDLTKIKKNFEDHNDHLDSSVLKKVPELLNDPMVIVEYKPGTGSNTVSVYGNLVLNNKPVAVGLVVTTGNGGNVISKIRTVHLQRELNTQITGDSILYLKENKKEINAWFQAYAGIDVPMSGTQLGVIRSIDFTNSIFQNDKLVNTSGERNSKELFADDRTMTAEAEKNTVAEDGVRGSKDITEEYSYKALVEKPDMKLTVLDSSVPDNRTDIINLAKRNAAKVGKIDKKTNSISVFVEDVGDSVVIGTKGLQHGLRRNSTLQTDATSFVTLKAGEIIKNSIRINELKPKNGDVKNTYVLIGAAKNSSGNLFIIESVVNKFGNELLSIDVLYSVNAKKENQLSSMLPGIRPPVTGSTISISDLLQYVNKYFPDVLPESVYKHFGHSERPQDELGKSALHSLELFTDDRTMTAEEIENDEIEQMIQTIKSSDDLSDADVQAIREELRESRKLRREKLLAEITSRNLERWGADIGRVEDVPKMSIDEAVKKVKEAFGINITHGGDASVSGKGVSGAYNIDSKTIRTKFKNDLPSIAHALGYHIDESLKVVDRVIEQTEKAVEAKRDLGLSNESPEHDRAG